MDCVAVDVTRVVLRPAVGGTDYVNASWVPGYRWAAVCPTALNRSFAVGSDSLS